MGIFREGKLSLLLSSSHLPWSHSRRVISRCFKKFSLYDSNDYINPRGFRVKSYPMPDYQCAVIFAFMGSSSKDINRLFERGVNLVNQYRGNATLDLLYKLEALLDVSKERRYWNKYDFSGSSGRKRKREEEDEDQTISLGLQIQEEIRSPFGFLLTDNLPENKVGVIYDFMMILGDQL